MDPILQDALNKLLAALVSALTVLVGYLLLYAKMKIEAYMKLKMGAEKLTTAKLMAETIVNALQQSDLWNQLDGPAKKAQAMAWMDEQLKRANITMTAEEISNVIEEAVHKMKLATPPSGDLITATLVEKTG